MRIPSGRWRAIATDFDGTLTEGAAAIDPAVIDGLRRLKASARALLLVTGRVLDDLFTVCPVVNMFDRVVAENGAVLYRPATLERITLAGPPDRTLMDRLARRNVSPLSCGDVIVATLTRHHAVVADTIRELGVDLEIILNEEWLMVLPRGVDKATGFRRALQELEVSAADTIAIGDAENDDCLLSACGCGVAVADAVPALKASAQLVTQAPRGRGVLEVIEAILATDDRSSPSE